MNLDNPPSPYTIEPATDKNRWRVVADGKLLAIVKATTRAEAYVRGGSVYFNCPCPLKDE